MKRRQFLHSAATAAAVAGFGLSSRASLAADDIKVGILHSQTGTMAVSEKPLLDMALMTIDEINQAGGIAGRKLVPVVSDPASDWPTYAKEARKMLENDKVAAVFGCWTSASRKEVLPVFKERDGLLFYPVQYEGEELERNVFYTGLAPNQQSIPALNYFYGDIGGAYRRFFLLGSDYVYPRTANRIIGNYLSRARGVAAADLAVEYTPLGHRDYADIVGRIKAFAAQGKKAMVVSTLNGDTNLHFFAALAQAGISANDVPVLSFSVDEALLGAMPTKPVGHFAAWAYFMANRSAENQSLIKRFRQWTGSEQALVTDPMVATHVGIHMFALAVAKVRSTRTDLVIGAMGGVRYPSPSGQMVMMDFNNHHLQRPVNIGRIRADGQFDILWESAGPLRAEPFNPYFKEAARLRMASLA